MNNPLAFTELENSNNIINKKESKSSKARCRTYKKREKESNKVKQFLNTMQHDDLPENSEVNNEELGEKWQPEDITNNNTMEYTDDNSILKEGLKQRDEYEQKERQMQGIYNKYMSVVPKQSNEISYYSDLANSQELSGPKDELMKKLNYVVHLLEEQQDQKTGSVTEEMVLYMFLGVFVIFVVDSFAKTGRYRRG